MKRDDTLWKSILEDIFEDFLLFFHPDAGSYFDFSKDFEYLDKELEQLFSPEDNLYQTRFVDSKSLLQKWKQRMDTRSRLTNCPVDQNNYQDH